MTNPAYIETNRLNWNARAKLHRRSADYAVDEFVRAGLDAEPDLAHRYDELGSLAGKRLLHLQCHLGMETVRFQYRGAIATGVDLSDGSIALAREIADAVRSDARFIVSSVEQLPDVLEESFDIVFASYGILCWIADVARWMEVAAHFLAPGGFLYLIDGHPLAAILADDGPDIDPSWSYFVRQKPDRFERHGSYVSENAHFEHPVNYQWTHSLAETVTAAIDAGLRIEELHEYPYAAYRAVSSMVEGHDGFWRLPEGDRLPFLFSIRASKP